MFGIIAAACALIPIVGDFIAVPCAVLALGFGLLGIRRHETGRPAQVVRATIGTVLGLLALFVVGILFAVAQLPA
ncbi:hypothetical protein [Leucobacter tenebrionis]|uniref:hypothetical protein n=1 Tax=Leucobacter tenebrionis TaxID=2873270 RepID=UPI001CA716FD|nr:hypothetical protein [Leucobacter tenebrionis]QZY52369.1 hypothetical protein KVY00_02565 [Leucobacter tenebrionis]